MIENDNLNRSGKPTGSVDLYIVCPLLACLLIKGFRENNIGEKLNRRPDIVGDHTHVACLLLPFVIFLHCSSSTSR